LKTSHSFTTSGDYTVELTVTDEYGATDTSSTTITVEKTFETVEWSTATDWDEAATESGVVHADYGDLPGAGVVQLGPVRTADTYAYWAMDGSNGVDVMGNGNDLSLSGVQTGVTGILDSTAYRFGGSTMSRSTSHTIDQFSISFWFKESD